MKKVFKCAWCFQPNEISIDLSEGDRQTFTESCQVCNRPNTIHVTIDENEKRVEVVNEEEG
jgi:YbbR domain-containing protein